MYDYSHIDREPSSPSYGSPVPAGSRRNAYACRADIVFTVIFVMEMILKIIGMGFFRGRQAYLKDGWNVLDFVITVGSAVALLPKVPSLSIFRTFRLLRPLRSVSRLPGLKKLITAMLHALPQTIDVLLYLFFTLFLIFGVVGMSLFLGSMSAVCRITPYPVASVWKPGMNYTEYRCLNAPNLDTLPPGTTWTKKSSPWATPQNCYWPTDDSDRRLCALERSQGSHKCSGTWCGSNYDYFGNPKFKGDAYIGMYDRYFTKEQLLAWPSWTPELNFGYTTFDNALLALIVLFQISTLEGWSELMFMIGDSGSLAGSAIFFFVFILFATFVILNVVVAVLEYSLHSFEEKPGADQRNKTHSFTHLKLKLKLAGNVSRLVCVHQGAISVSHVKTKGRMYRLVSNPWFNVLISLVILLNTAVLASDHYPSTPQFDSTGDKINFACTLLFILDMALRISGLGVFDYFSDRFNLFDSFLVFLGILELVLSPPQFLAGRTFSKQGNMSALRTLRLLRLFKLAKHWKSMRILFAKMVKSAVDMVNFFLLLALFIYILSLVGMEFFANRFRFDDLGFPVEISDPNWNNFASSRVNFDSLIWAICTVFSILTLEDWSVVLYDGWRGTNQSASSIYFIILILFGQVILMNLFLAILLSHFEETEELSENFAEAEFSEAHPRINQVADEQALRNNTKQDTAETIRCASPIRSQLDTEGEKDDQPTLSPHSSGKTIMLFGPIHYVRVSCAEIINHWLFDSFIMFVILSSTTVLAMDSPLHNPASSLSRAVAIIDSVCAVIFLTESCLKIVSFGLIFEPQAYFRSGWNILDFFVVVVSLVELCSQNGSANLRSLRSLRALRAFRPLRMIKQVPSLKVVVNGLISVIPKVLEVVAVALFFLLVFGIIGLGLLKGTMRNCNLGIEDSPGSLYDPLSLKPNKFGQLLVYPKSWEALSSIEKAWFGPASPFDMPSFEGNCSVLWPEAPCCSAWPKESFVIPTSRQICECWGSSWRVWSGQLTFDNIGQAMLSFYSISTLAGWFVLMLESIDQREIGMQPVRNYNVCCMFLYLSFIIVVHYVIMNLVVGVIVEGYQKQEAGNGFCLLTEQQQAIAKTVKLLQRVRLTRKHNPPDDHFGKVSFQIVTNVSFELFITCCILLNLLILLVQHRGQPEQLTVFVTVMEYIFCLGFTLEAILYIGAFRRSYFQDHWCQLDFCIVLATDISVLIHLTAGVPYSPGSMVLRTCRVGRVFRLMKNAKTLTKLFPTLISTLLGLANICGVWFLLLAIFAILGNQQYAMTAFYGSYNEDLNFQTFANSVLTLLVFSVGGKWDLFMMDAASTTPGCVDNPSYNPNMCGFSDRPDCVPLNGCGQQSIILFMCVFQFVVSTVMLNLFMGVIVGEMRAQSNPDDMVNEHDFKVFSTHWTRYDPGATYFISFLLLEDFLRTIPPPWDKYSTLSQNQMCDKIASWKLKLFNGNSIHFFDMFGSLAEEVVVQDVSTNKGKHFKESLHTAVEHFKGEKILRECVATLEERAQWRKEMETYSNKNMRSSNRRSH